MRGRRTACIVSVVALLAAFVSGAQAVDDTPDSALDRAAFIALPAIYRMTVTIRVDQLADDRHRVAIGRTVEFDGTAFGVGSGIVVTARPLVRPSAPVLMAAIDGLHVARTDTFDPNDVRVTSSLMSIVLRRATPDATPSTTLNATILQTTAIDVPSKLAILRIPDRDAPALQLDDATTLGTPVALVAFGVQRATEPAVQHGRLGPAGKVNGSNDGNLVTVSGVEAAAGNAGGPVIDEQGHVRGVLIQQAVAVGESSVITRSIGVRELASNAGVTVGTTSAEAAFADGMQSFWAREYSAAQESLHFASERVPNDTWIGALATRAQALSSADYVVVRSAPWRLPLIMGGIVALALMLLLAARFWSMED